MSKYAATISQPSKKDYRRIEDEIHKYKEQVDWLLDPRNPLNNRYEQLLASDRSLNQALMSFENVAQMAANNQMLLAQDAARIANLQGPPPPDKGAEAPLIGKAREPWRPASERGRQALRIRRED
jgi:hypothetical protein